MSATVAISSKEGVIRPESATSEAFSRRAAAMISCGGTITPRSTTRNPLQESTTPTIFLPISCTSPFTVASTTVAAAVCPACSASSRGVSTATLCFITRALFTTCGRNILPEPKSSPTCFMPSMSGPSITCSGVPQTSRASRVSASICSVMPLTSACARRSCTLRVRQSACLRGAAAGAPAPAFLSASRASASSCA